MIRASDLLRLTRIQWVLLRHGVDDVVLALPMFRPLRWFAWLMPWRWFRARATRGERIRTALEDLGPIFVKFGQILSTRRDLLPPDVVDELSRLQDRVPPFPGYEARRIVERFLDQPLEEVFEAFDVTPIASASIAQVHGATLRDGSDVVVKVVRPRVRRIIQRDVRLLYAAAHLAERYSGEARRLHPVEVIREFDKTLHDELDLLREAANASQLRRNFVDSPLLYVPAIHWRYTGEQVLVMERIHGIPVSHVETLREHGINLRRLAEKGTEIFFTQVFRDSFFHADMHPGNVFVDPDRPGDDPRYIAVDFGIMGTLAPVDHHYLAANFLAFFNRDYRRVAELHVESGWVPAGTRVDEFESAIRTVCEPIFERPLHEISFGALLLRLFQTGRRFEMEVQPQLVLLQKTLLAVEGLGRQLYPELDLWATARPHLERWMNEQVGVRGVTGRLARQWPDWAQRIPEIPGRLDEGLHDLHRLRAETEAQRETLQALTTEIRQARRQRTLWRGVLVAAVIAGVLWWAGVLPGVPAFPV